MTAPASTETAAPDCLGDEDRPDEVLTPYDEVVAAQALAVLRSALLRCTPREERILRHLYGLGNTRQMTANEVGYLFGVTDARVDQIKKKAFRQMRRDRRLLALLAA